MKNILKAICIIFILSYVAGAFGYASLNINKWGQEGRMTLACTALAFSLISAAVIGISEADKKDGKY